MQSFNILLCCAQLNTEFDYRSAGDGVAANRQSPPSLSGVLFRTSSKGHTRLPISHKFQGSVPRPRPPTTPLSVTTGSKIPKIFTWNLCR